MLGVAGMDGYFKIVNPAFERTLVVTGLEDNQRRLSLPNPPIAPMPPPLDQVAKLRPASTSIPLFQRLDGRCRGRDGRYVWLSRAHDPHGRERPAVRRRARHHRERARRGRDRRAQPHPRTARNASLERQNAAPRRLPDRLSSRALRRHQPRRARRDRRRHPARRSRRTHADRERRDRAAHDGGLRAPLATPRSSSAR